MTPFQAYLLYSAIHAHFTTKYDFFKYGGKMRLTRETFEKRNDKHFYNKLAKHKDPQGLIVSNHVYRDVKWIGDLFDEKSDEIFNAYNKYRAAIGYHYKQELGKALNTSTSFNALLAPTGGNHPPLLVLLMRKQVSPETVIIIDGLVDMLPSWERYITDTLMWPKINAKLLKFKPFYEFDSVKLREITRQVCLNTVQE